MKVIALGCAGEMGRQAVTTLHQLNPLLPIVIADRDEAGAEALASNLGDTVTFCYANVDDSNSLEGLLSSGTVVMNTVGPYFRFGVKVLDACIRARCHYVDINDDWEPTLEMLERDERAKDAAITAIIGMGATPGISNMLAVLAAYELDEVHEMVTGWDLDSAHPEKIQRLPSAATVHGFHQMTGEIKVFQNAQFHHRKPLETMTISYPGLGERQVMTIGHPEAVTFPRYFPTLTSSFNVMFASPFTRFGLRLLIAGVERGLLTIETAASLAEKTGWFSHTPDHSDMSMNKLVHRIKKQLPPLFALASGLKNGKNASVGSMILSAPAGGMAGVTGIPLAIATDLILKGKVRKHGVFAPEGVVTPEIFFSHLAPLCDPQKSGINDLILTTRSWEDISLIERFIEKYSAE